MVRVRVRVLGTPRPPLLSSLVLIVLTVLAVCLHRSTRLRKAGSGDDRDNAGAANLGISISMKVYYTIVQPSGRSLRPLQKCTSTHHLFLEAASDR